MTDPSSKELLYNLPIPYVEKYKIAELLKLCAYLPPENPNNCPFIELPQDMINIICKYLDNEWELKTVCNNFLSCVNEYQSTIQEVKIKHNEDVNNIKLMKKYYTGINKLIVQKVRNVAGITLVLCVRQPNLKMNEILTWNTVKVLELEDFDDRKYIDYGINCLAETIIIRTNAMKFLKMFLGVGLPNLKSIELCEMIDDNDSYNDYPASKSTVEYLNDLVKKTKTLKTISFFIKAKSDDDITKFLSKTRNATYRIKSCEEIKFKRVKEYMVNIEGQCT